MALDFNFAFTSGGGGGGTLTVNATILNDSPLGCAPHAVELDITVSGQDTNGTVGSNGYAPLWHDIEYIVDWYYNGTDNSYVWANLQRVFNGSQSHPNGHRNSRYGYGPQPTHVYRTAGTYTPRVWAYERSSGKSGFFTLPAIVVASQDATFPTTNTVFLSPSGNFAAAPSGAVQVTSGDVASAFTTYVRNAGSPKRIMLNRGETYTWPSIDIGAWYANAFPSFIITAGGSGAKPLCNLSGDLQYDDRNGTTAGKTLAFQGVEIVGGYSDQSTGGNTGDMPLWLLGTNIAECIIYDDVKISACDAAILSGDDIPTTTSIFLNGLDCENVSYGLLLRKARLNRMGCRIDSRTTAIVNSTSNQGWGSRFDCVKSYTQSCESHRNQGWSGFGSQIAVQECERISTGGVHQGALNYYVGCVFEASRGAMAIGYSETGANDVPLNVVIDMSYLIGGYQADHVLKTGAGGVTVRNTTILQPDVQGRLVAGDDFQRFVYLTSSAALTTLNRDTPIKVYNNNLINRQLSSRNAFGKTTAATEIENVDGFTLVTNNNNINHQTLGNGNSITTRDPLSADTNVYTIRDVGYLSSTQDLRASTAPLTTAGMSDDYEPTGGSSAIDAATSGLISYFNQRGVVRDGTPNIGAI